MASPKKKAKPRLKAAKNPKRQTDSEVLRKLFPPQVVDYVETQLKDTDETDKK
jgi:hypothetical protein